MVRIYNFLERLVQSLLTLLKVLVLSRRATFRREIVREGDSCIILANGPSLNRSIAEHPDFLAGRDLLAVNLFANTTYFVELKPQMYVINAPELWAKDAMQSCKDTAREVFTNLVTRTSWRMVLCVPVFARKDKAWREWMATNPNIRVGFYNTTPVEGFGWFNRLLYRTGCGMPRPHNVLVPSLMVTIAAGYKSIFLMGVDHSWLKDLWVTDSNEVLLTQKHFYDEKTARALPMNKKGVGERRLDEILHKFMLSFRAYFEIDEYAVGRGVRIVNLTPGSYIDAFERQKL